MYSNLLTLILLVITLVVIKMIKRKGISFLLTLFLGIANAILAMIVLEMTDETKISFILYGVGLAMFALLIVITGNQIQFEKRSSKILMKVFLVILGIIAFIPPAWFIFAGITGLSL